MVDCQILPEDVFEDGVALDERLAADLVLFDVRVEAEDAAGTERGNGQEYEHVREVAIDYTVGNIPVPEVEHEHHERAEERREADDRADEQSKTDEQFAPRDSDVREFDEPRGRAHPGE